MLTLEDKLFDDVSNWEDYGHFYEAACIYIQILAELIYNNVYVRFYS